MTPGFPVPDRPAVSGNGEILLPQPTAPRMPGQLTRPGASTRMTQAIATVQRDILSKFELALGGRAKMVDALALATAVPAAQGRSEDAEYVVGLLADPANAARSLTAIASSAGITLEDLLRLYRESLTLDAHLQAIRQVMAQLPAVAADVMKRSVPYEEPCGRCQGVGQVTPNPTSLLSNPMPMPCPDCRATGRLAYTPDLKTQELALTLGGLLKSGGGVTVVQSQTVDNSQQTLIAAHGSTLVRMQAAADEILYGRPDPAAADPPETIDAEPPPMTP